MSTTIKPFRHGHLARLHGFNDPTLDGKLVRVKRFYVEFGANPCEFLDDSTRPPVPMISVPMMLMVQPQHMKHACEYCLVASATLMICGKCKTSHYCNAECQRADWARHKEKDCVAFGHVRGLLRPLPSACVNANLAEVRRLVEEEGADVDKATSSGPTPLYAAAMSGALPVVQYLMEQGADINKADEDGSIALHIAALNGNLPMVRYMVERNADMEKLDGDGATPLCLAEVLGEARRGQGHADQQGRNASPGRRAERPLKRGAVPDDARRGR